MSIAGGLLKSLERVRLLKCKAMQIFSRSPRSFRGRPIDACQAREFLRRKKELGIYPLVVHSVYTQNLGSCKKHFHSLCIHDFIEDLADARALGADFVVTHIGSFKGSTYKESIDRVVAALKQILKSTNRGVKILLENASGAGKLLGTGIHQFSYIMDKLNYPKNLGLCLDTCHAWCFGYDISSAGGIDKFLAEIDALIGIDRLYLVHLNDTKDSLGSKKDRHCHIGQGKIGLKAFKIIVNHSKLRHLPFILETPRDNDNDDIMNLNIVRRLRRN